MTVYEAWLEMLALAEALKRPAEEIQQIKAEIAKYGSKQ